MTKLPKYFLLQVWKEIDSRIVLKDILNYFEEQDKFICIQNIYDNTYGDEAIHEKLRDTRKKRNQTKKRWKQSALKEYQSPTKRKPKELGKEYEYLVGYRETIGEQQFSQTFNQKTPEEIIEEKIALLEEWSESTDTFLSNYLYINNKTDSQIEKALTADIIVIMGDLINMKYDGKIQDAIVEKPFSYVDNPVFQEKQLRLPLTSEVVADVSEENIGDFYYHDYSPSKDYIFRTLIPKSYLESKEARALDEKDRDILHEVMNYRTNMFAKQRKIFVNLGKIVKNVYESDGIKNYKLLEARLFKMLNMRFNVFHKKGAKGFGIFDYIEIDYTSWTAEITINEQIHQEYLSNQTIRIYNDSIQALEKLYSKDLAFVLQKERFSCFKGEQSYEQSYDYTFFSHKIPFNSKNKKENIKIIEDALEENVTNNLWVESFQRKGDSFNVKYKPVTDYEIEDLIHSASSSEELLNLPTPNTLFDIVE